MRFNHVALSVASLERSMEFYRQHFGMEKLCDPFPFAGEWYEQIMALDNPQGQMVMIGKNGMNLELFEFHNPDQGEQDPDRPVSKRGITHFGIEVDDIDEVYERMHAAGVRFHCPVLTFGTTTKAFYARDPDGNVFELVESLQQT